MIVMTGFAHAAESRSQCRRATAYQSSGDLSAENGQEFSAVIIIKMFEDAGDVKSAQGRQFSAQC